MAKKPGQGVSSYLKTFTVFEKDDIESNKAPFVDCDKAVAILANRYDGIDFPNDECRLLCLDGLPRAMNSQERFVMSKMGASALYNERIQARVLQAVGRCTRALQDRSAVLVTGTELVDSLVDNRKWGFFNPELQAELKFGVDQSTGVDASAMLDNFRMFMENSAEWAEADQAIRNDIAQYKQLPYPEMNELGDVVHQEVVYQEALWNHDYGSALAAARTILGILNHKHLRGYRALWHYLAGSASLMLSAAPLDSQSQAARAHFSEARKAAPSVSWLNTLARAVGDIPTSGEDTRSPETLQQVEMLEQQFLAMGVSTNNKFEKKAARILNGLVSAGAFESSQVELGTMLGFTAGNDESDATPDPWWLGNHIGIVFEDHANANDTTIFGANKARQVSSHPKWIKQNVPGTDSLAIFPILVTPCTQAKSGAAPQLDDVHYWLLTDYKIWVNRAVSILRELKGTFPGKEDLVWRAEAVERLECEKMTLEALLKDLPLAIDSMEIVS